MRAVWRMYYVRKLHPRCVHTKNGDLHIVRLHRHVSHYRVIRDARPDEFLISIYWRRANLEHVSDYKTHPRHTLRVLVTNLIPD
jgi:hypothetical protein